MSKQPALVEHGEAFSDFPLSYGIEEPVEPRLPDGRRPLPTRANRWRDLRISIGVGNGLGIVPTMLGSIATRDFAAIHMMWGAVNELTTLTATTPTHWRSGDRRRDAIAA